MSMKLIPKLIIPLIVVVIFSIALIVATGTTATNQCIANGFVYDSGAAEYAAEDIEGFEIVALYEFVECANYSSYYDSALCATEYIAEGAAEDVETDEIYEANEYINHVDADIVFLGKIREDNTPVFIKCADIESFLDCTDHLMRIHQGAVVELLSEVIDGKVYVLVTSVGDWPVHNGWYTWTLWIPYDSFEHICG